MRGEGEGRDDTTRAAECILTALTMADDAGRGRARIR